MISRHHSRVAVPLAAVGLLLAACGGAAAPSATSAPTPTPPVAAATPTPTTAATTGTWTVTSASTATVRVREQLVGVNLPSDAVLVAKGATGSFVLNADGTFIPASRISFDSRMAKSTEPVDREAGG